jgi:hypothetical protein
MSRSVLQRRVRQGITTEAAGVNTLAIGIVGNHGPERESGEGADRPAIESRLRRRASPRATSPRRDQHQPGTI